SKRGPVSVNLIVDTPLGPMQPDFLGKFVREKISFFVFEKIIDRIDSRYLLEAFDESNIVPDIFAYRIADEIKVGHWLRGQDTLLPDGCRGCLGFESACFKDDSALPIQRFFDGDRSVAVPAAVDYAPDRHSIFVVISRVDVFEISEPHRIAGVTVCKRNWIALRVRFPLEPFPRKVAATVGMVHTHALPVGLVVRTREDVRKDDFKPGSLKSLENEGVILRVHVFYDPEYTVFYVNRSKLTIYFAEIGDVVPDYLFARQHRGRGFSAGRGKSPAKASRTSLFLVLDSHDEHVLAQPSLRSGELDRQAHGVFLKPNAVSGVLIICRKDYVVLHI